LAAAEVGGVFQLLLSALVPQAPAAQQQQPSQQQPSQQQLSSSS
jgi:hypothetical protein